MCPQNCQKLKRPNYKSIETYFQIDGLSDDSEAHHPSSVKPNFHWDIFLRKCSRERFSKSIFIGWMFFSQRKGAKSWDFFNSLAKRNVFPRNVKWQCLWRFSLQNVTVEIRLKEHYLRGGCSVGQSRHAQ